MLYAEQVHCHNPMKHVDKARIKFLGLDTRLKNPSQTFFRKMAAQIDEVNSFRSVMLRPESCPPTPEHGYGKDLNPVSVVRFGI